MNASKNTSGRPAIAELADWRGKDVTVAEVGDVLARAYREHVGPEHGHTAARTLNLVVALPGEPKHRDAVAAEAAVGGHNPARTVLLCEHRGERIDADLGIECDTDVQAGIGGVCHDWVALYVNEERLEHAHSLVDPLLVRGLPIVVWLPGAGPGPAEESLVAIADHVVIDSTVGEPVAALDRAARLAQQTTIHDLAWLRLADWRARVAATFEPPDWRELLAKVELVRIGYLGGSPVAGLLAAGWFAARLGWQFESLASSGGNGDWSGRARASRGRTIEIAIERQSGKGQEGLAHSLTEIEIVAGKRSVQIAARDHRVSDQAVVMRALGFVETAMHGYGDTLAALAGPLRKS